MQSDVKVSCLGCGGSGRVITPINPFNPTGEGTCAMCGGTGMIPIVSVGSFVDQRDAEILRLRAQVDQLQAANTRLLEERRAVDESYMVEHFHRACDVPVLRQPRVPEEARVRLRLNLIAEEFIELCRAVFETDDDEDFVEANRFADSEVGLFNAIRKLPVKVILPDFADACADLKYVIVGSELEFGIDGRPIFRGVHEANLKKVDGPRRADGKVQKPEGWKPFDVGAELRTQGWRGP